MQILFVLLELNLFIHFYDHFHGNVTHWSDEREEFVLLLFRHVPSTRRGLCSFTVFSDCSTTLVATVGPHVQNSGPQSESPTVTGAERFTSQSAGKILPRPFCRNHTEKNVLMVSLL